MRELQVLLNRVDEEMRDDPREETRDVRQQLEHWMRRLEQMARDDTFDCESAEREIKSLKNKVDYVERLLVHQGRSRGSQYRRSTTPRPPTVPDTQQGEGDRSSSASWGVGGAPIQQPPSRVSVQRPHSENQNQITAAGNRQQYTEYVGYNQGSRRNSEVDKWLPATRERYSTQMAANKYRERHFQQRKQDSHRKADEMVRGLVEADAKPWKPRRDRRPTQGLTGLLDHRVIEEAEVDPARPPDAIWVEEHSAPRTYVVNNPGNSHPDWLIRQGQRHSSSRRKGVKQINMYHRNNGDDRREGSFFDDSRLLGDQESDVNIIDYETPRRPRSHSRTYNSTGKSDGSLTKI